MTTTLTWPRFPALARGLALVYALALAGCGTITLVSDYDETTDQGVTAFQKSVETFLTKLEHADRPAGALTKDETAFFDQAKVDLSSLGVRAASIPKNQLTVEMLANLTNQISILERLVPLGITKEQVKPVRDAMNASTGAILKFEIAKKRGGKEADAKP